MVDLVGGDMVRSLGQCVRHDLKIDECTLTGPSKMVKTEQTRDSILLSWSSVTGDYRWP